jgi:APA family basic amino acid/polyamine antiporter
MPEPTAPAARPKRDAPTAATAAPQPTLVRALGGGSAIALVVGYVIGAGIFLKPGQIAAEVGDFRLILTAWVAGGLLCLLGALCFAELAAMLPRAGGLYVYLREAFGRPVAFLYGWNEVFFARPASLGALSTAFVGSLSRMSGIADLPPLARAGFATLLVVTLAGVNVLGVIWGGRLQNATTLIKVGFLMTLAILPFALLPLVTGGFDAANYTSTTVPPAGSTLATQFSAALLAVLWAYNGWHNVTPVAEEIHAPQRTIPRALLVGVTTLIVLYVSVNCAYHGVLSMERMAAAKDHAAEEMLRALLGPAGSAFMSAVIMCSTFGAINGNLLITPRIAFAMGRDGVFFRPLGEVHARFRTPAIAIVVEASMAVALVWASAVLVTRLPALRDRSLFAMLTDFVIFASSLFYVLGVLAVLVLRRTHPDWSRPYRTWGYPVVPVLFLAAYAWFLGQVYVAKPFEARAGLVLIAAGVPVYGLWQALSARSAGTAETES